MSSRVPASSGKLPHPHAKATPTYFLAFGFGAIIVLLSVLMLTWLTTVDWISHDLKTIADRHNAKIEMVSTMRDIARSRMVSLHRMIMLDDPFDRDAEYLRFMAQANKYVSVREAFLALPLSNQEKSAWEELRRVISAAQTRQEQVAVLALAEQIPQARTLLLRDGIPIQDSLMQSLTHLLNLEQESTHDAISAQQSRYEQTRRIVVTLGAVALLSSLVISIFVVGRARLAERVLVEATRAAQEASGLKSEFLARVSHELRTPLNAVIGYSELLIEQAQENRHDGYVSDLEKIQSAGRYLLALIDEVLDLSKIEAGKLDLQIEEIYVCRLIDEVIATVQLLATANENVLKVRCGEVGVMHSDLKYIRQILLNILANACKFTIRGIVTLEVDLTRDNGRSICFRIADTGIGMSPEQLRRLFQPFVQGDESIGRRFGGTGLGLAISRRLCHALGGDIEVESNAGQGTVFTVWLPLEPVQDLPGGRIAALKSNSKYSHTPCMLRF